MSLCNSISDLNNNKKMQGFVGINYAGGKFYRNPESIRRDIGEISERITEVNEMLNIRELLADFIGEDSEREVMKRAEELSELLTFASETLDELMELNSSLEELKRELIGTIAAIGW